MGQDPTVKPTVSNAKLAEERQQIASNISDTDRQTVDSAEDTAREVQPKTTDSAARAGARVSDEAPLLSVAAVMMGDYPTFIDALFRAVATDVTPAAVRKLHRAARSASDEAASFDRLAVVAIDDAKLSTAAKICAALAARTAGLSAQRLNGTLDPADAAELFTAWLETARAMIAARGFAGLWRLLPTARLLARRSAERGGSAAEIAATMRRIAARIVAELSLERAFDLAAAEQELDPTEQRTVNPRSALSQSPAQMTLHPR